MNCRRSSWKPAGQVYLGVLVALLCPILLQGQGLTGEVRIEVKDPSGAAMQASGKLQNLANGVVRSFQTDAEGAYAFASLPYARYRLEVSRQGFATQSLLVDVHSGAPISRTISLALGTASATVDVVATTPLAGSDQSLREI